MQKDSRSILWLSFCNTILSNFQRYNHSYSKFLLKCRLLQSASFFIYLVYICIFVAAFRLNFGICRHCSKDLFAFYVALYACCMFSQKIERNCAVESANRYVVLVQSKLIKVNYAIQDSKSIIMFFNGTPGAIRTRGLSLRRRPLYPAELRAHIWKYKFPNRLK